MRTRFVLILTVLLAGHMVMAQTDGAATAGSEARAVEEQAKRPWYKFWGSGSDDTDEMEEAEDLAEMEEQENILAELNQAELEAALSGLPTKRGEATLVKGLEITGETAFFEGLKSVTEPGWTVERLIREEVIGRYLTADEVKDLCRRITADEFAAQKYLLAYVAMEGDGMPADGMLRLIVRTGKFGYITIMNEPTPGEDSLVFLEYYFSTAQLRRKFSMLPGDAFDYGLLQRELYGVNSHPDLTVNADLNVKQGEDGDKVVDVDLLVQEQMPLHAALQIDNLGTENADEWRAGLTLQYLNLTRAWDPLTLNLTSAFDGSVMSASASYQRPFGDTTLTIFGGGTEVDIDDVLAGVDSEGEGYFGGLQLRTPLYQSTDHHLGLMAGYTRRRASDALTVAGTVIDPDRRQLDMAPLSFGLEYRNLALDGWNGRNFMDYTFVVAARDFLGSDGDDAFQAYSGNPRVDADYNLHRLRAARLQRLPGADGRWQLYLKGEGQIAGVTLADPERFAIGGMGTVRGYPERVALGDDGWVATIEVRTPILDRNSLKSTDEAYEEPNESLQFVLFNDWGLVRNRHELAGEADSVEMVSVGAGLRLSVTQYAQLTFDYGFQLRDLDLANDPDDAGRGHVIFQLQY